MEKEKIQEIAFQMIGNIGEAKTNFVFAIDEAEKGNYDKAEELIKLGTESFATAGRLHLEIVQEEAKGIDLPFSIIFMHAEDQYLTTEVIKMLAQKFITLNKKIDSK